MRLSIILVLLQCLFGALQLILIGLACVLDQFQFGMRLSERRSVSAFALPLYVSGNSAGVNFSLLSGSRSGRLQTQGARHD